MAVASRGPAISGIVISRSSLLPIDNLVGFKDAHTSLSEKWTGRSIDASIQPSVRNGK